MNTTRLMMILAAMIGLGVSASGSSAPTAKTGVVRLAMVEYAGGKTGRCFSADFLSLLSYETTIVVDPTLAHVALYDPKLFDYPFVILTGEGEFRLNDAERANLRRYLRSGGTMIVSAGCTNALWAGSMRRELKTIFPEGRLVRLGLDNEVFHTVFDVADLVTTRGAEGELYGLEIDGRLALMYSPQGLNDTADAGGTCCCCGGDEIRQAKYLNANLVAYALTR